jgi:hypothetical protein
MSNTVRFKVFCLEQYKNAHGLKGGEAMRLFRQYGVLDYIDAFFDILHSYGGKYLVQDIDSFIQSRRGESRAE